MAVSLPPNNAALAQDEGSSGEGTNVKGVSTVSTVVAPVYPQEVDKYLGFTIYQMGEHEFVAVPVSMPGKRLEAESLPVTRKKVSYWWRNVEQEIAP